MADPENDDVNNPKRGKLKVKQKYLGTTTRHNGASTSTGNPPPPGASRVNWRSNYNQSNRNNIRGPVPSIRRPMPHPNGQRVPRPLLQIQVPHPLLQVQVPYPVLQGHASWAPPQQGNSYQHNFPVSGGYSDRGRNRARSTSTDTSRGHRRDLSVLSERGPRNKYENNRPINKFPGGEKHQYRVGFKFLESIVQIENHDDALNKIMAKKTELFQYLDSPYSLDNCDKYIILIKILAKIYNSTFTEMKSELFLEIGKFKFTENLQLYFTNLSYQTEMERARNRYFWNNPIDFWNAFLTFCEGIQIISPHFAYEKCRPLVDIATTLIHPTFVTKYNITLPEESLRRFEDLKKKFLSYEMQLSQKKEQEGNANCGPAPDDFRELEVFPGAEDLLQNKQFVRPNIIDGSYENIEHYLDVQFRLLREDCYGPLRIGIQQFRKDRSKRRYDNVRVYREANMIEPILSSNQFGVLVQWDKRNKKHFSKINWTQSKRLIFGSLLVFIGNNFRDFIIGTVLNRDTKFLANGTVVVHLYNADPCDKKLYEVTYSMLESQVYFEPYLHVLRALQDPEFSKHLPMHEYIVNVKHAPTPPAYIKATTAVMVRTTNGLVKFKVLDTTMWPEFQKLGLDESQHEAFKSALTQEFVVIQGPPGTGKTFVGALIAKTLLKNFNRHIVDTINDDDNDLLDQPKNSPVDNGPDSSGKNESAGFACRLLLLCYTNHALDQFLEHVLCTTESVVRIGGQSRNRNLDKYNLTQLRRTARNSQTFIKMRFELEDANALLATVQDEINIFNQGVYSYETLDTLCEDVSALKNYPGDSKDPLINWLFEYTEHDGNELHPEYLVHNENDNNADDKVMFNFDDVGIDEDRRQFYKNSSSVKASFFIGNEYIKLNELFKSYNNCNEYAKRDDIGWQINNCRNRLHLFQKIIKNRDGLKRLNIYSKPRVSLFNLEERWGVYFGWASRFKGSLLKRFQLAKEKQEKKFEIYEEARMMMDLSILRRARVVGVTTTGAARIRKLLQALETPIVIVEEAAEVMEAHIIAALTKHCQHLILIGDHQQLRPSAAHFKLARHYNLEVSLFERMVRTGASTSRLRLQHRMRPEIAALISPAIYPDLQNHFSVLRYPRVRGLTTNLYFLTHENREEFEEETLSRSNVFEADMMLKLANYIMQQDYDSEDITILTTYSSQMFYMKNKRSQYPLLKDTKITVVDKYQGEECKIILLSLVRNNVDGEVGFLATDNRVCVALSRAKEGMYIMGNMDILKAKSELWTKIAATLESNQSLGGSFVVKCQQHPTNITEIKSLDDFFKVPEGGCLNKCKSMLDCGHGCPLLCHSYDKNHEKVNCIEKCNRIRCALEHKCPKLCHEDCGPCTVMLVKELPCGHREELACHIEPEDKSVRCMVDLKVTLPACGHETNKHCYQNLNTILCHVKCVERLACGHTCRRNCHKNNDPDHEKYQCQVQCAKTKSGCSMVFADGADFKEHRCLKMCYEECDPCLVKVSKKRNNCIHKDFSECSKDVNFIPCQKRCSRALPCKHFCKNKCFQQCTRNCMQEVEKVVSACGHKVKVACSVTPTTKDCYQNCTKKLACGHTCILKCYEECDCNGTTQISTPLLCGHTTVPCRVYRKGTTGLDPVQLLRECAAPCGATLACGHACAGTCGSCRQGRLHESCRQPCGRTLICGHVCEDMCNKGCPPCKKRCEMACEHNRCPRKCGVPCVQCKEECGRVCPHGACKRKCDAPCDREPCNERCPLALQCGHPCRGLCGEVCPPLCDVCRPDDFPAPLLGDRFEDDDLFIVLKDCGHCMEVTEADMMMQSEPDGEVHVRRCPVCRKPIINTSRYKDIVNRLFRSEINPIKRRLYGDEKEVQENRCKIATKILEVAINSKVSDVIIHAEIFTHCTRVLRYLHGNKKLSLPRLNALMVITDILEIIYEYVKRFISGNLTEFQEYFMDSVKVLLKMVTNDLKTISEQQQLDVSNEIKRLRYVLQLATLVADSTYKAGKHVPAVKAAYDSAVEAVTTWRVFDETAAVEALKKLETESKASGIVTKEERDLVVRALNMKPGHWYKCPNGHFYCIGECGGAMERGRCPDCGATVGGADHALASGNRHAGELDGSRHPAWSEAANMANYQH